MNISDFAGHPGFAPFVWWVVGLLLAVELIYFAVTTYRYWRVHSRAQEAKSHMVFSLTRMTSFIGSLILVLLMLQLLLIGQAPFLLFILSIVVASMNIVVYVMTT